jgi:DNA-binding MurR/RpiR family transcriptional regulator
MVQKLGYKGYPDFQAELREGFARQVKKPGAKHDVWASLSEHLLNAGLRTR